MDGNLEAALAAAIAALTITQEHEKKIDFPHPFYSTSLGIAVSGKVQNPYSKLYKAINFSRTVT